MVTLKHIAENCGVSVASVSKALNHMPGVGRETAERILRVAEELGYLPNAAARALKTNRSYNIGVLLEDDDRHGLLHQFFVTVLEGFRLVMEGRGFDLMLMNRTMGRRRVSYLEHCRHSNLDGVFIACIDFSDPQLLELAKGGVPLVSIDHSFPGHPSVYSDNRSGMLQAVAFAHGKGHRHIAYISGAPSSISQIRVDAYRDALQQYGLPFRQAYLRTGRFRDVALTRRIVADLIRLETPPTCILMPDDYAALGGRQAIEDAGLCIAREISVIGFDGLEYLEHIRPRLTTVRQDAMRIGVLSARLLLRHMEGSEDETGNTTEIVPVTLVKGDTVLAARNPRLW